jgi:F0F1-type ATP synthase assembly protein I
MMYNNAGTAMADDSEKSSQQKQSNTKQCDAVKSLVQVESLIQLGLVLPIATVIGLLIGMGLDKWLHQHWIYIPGLILGAVAGFVHIFRVVLALSKE